MEVINYLITDIFLNIFFCVQQQKETRTGLEPIEDEYITPQTNVNNLNLM